MATISNPYIRDTITVDAAFNARLATWTGPGPLHLLARVVDLQEDLLIGPRQIVLVTDRLRGNGLLIDARGVSSEAHGARGSDAGPTPPSSSGGDGAPGGSGSPGGSVTVMCRLSEGVRINTSGGNGANGGAGGNGGPGSPATSVPGGTTTEIVFDADGIPHEVEVQLPDIEIPGTLGGGGGFGGHGGAGGTAGAITFTSMSDDTLPVLEAFGGRGGAGGAGGLTGPHGAFAEVPDDVGGSAAPGDAGATQPDGAITVTTLTQDDYVAGLRPLLDTHGSFANHWAPYRIVVGQYFYRQDRRGELKDDGRTAGQLADTELVRALELQPDNAEALRWQRQLRDFPRPRPVDPQLTWEPGGLNALGLSREQDVMPLFEAYRNAFTSFSALVLDFLRIGTDALVQAQDIPAWRAFLDHQHRQALAAQKTTAEDQSQARTEARLAAEALDGVQSRLEQTTRDIQAARAEMEEEELDLLGVVGTVAGVAAAVVAVVAAVPSLGTSLVALAPSMVALSSAVIDNAEPIAKALLAGDPAKTDQIKKAYADVETKAADVVKGAKAIVSFVEVVQKLSASATPDNSKHLALVRQGVELTHELLLARQRVTLAQERVQAADARVARAADAVTSIGQVKDTLALTAEGLRTAALHAIGIAGSKADALLTLAFLAQRSVEIYTLTDHEGAVPLESGHLHPDGGRDFDEGWLTEIQLVQKLTDAWSGLLGIIDLQQAFLGSVSSFPDRDRRRLSFPADGPEAQALRTTRRLSFRVDPAALPAGQFDAKALSVRVALVGASAPTSEVTCRVAHGSAYTTRRTGGSIHVQILQPRSSNRDASLVPLQADDGDGPDPPLTEPRSLAFWGRGIGGDWEVSIPDHEFDAGLDLAGLTQVQVWIGYQFHS